MRFQSLFPAGGANEYELRDSSPSVLRHVDNKEAETAVADREWLSIWAAFWGRCCYASKMALVYFLALPYRLQAFVVAEATLAILAIVTLANRQSSNNSGDLIVWLWFAACVLVLWLLSWAIAVMPQAYLWIHEHLSVGTLRAHWAMVVQQWLPLVRQNIRDFFSTTARPVEAKCTPTAEEEKEDLKIAPPISALEKLYDGQKTYDRDAAIQQLYAQVRNNTSKILNEVSEGNNNHREVMESIFNLSDSSSSSEVSDSSEESDL
jgi:hypothetical protein